MVSTPRQSALFFIMESDVHVPGPCFLAGFLGSAGTELLLPPVLTCDPLHLFKGTLQ